MPSPDGTTPDFEHPTDVLKTVLFVTQGFCIAVCSLIVVLRIFVKYRFQLLMALDDCKYIFSIVLCPVTDLNDLVLDFTFVAWVGSYTLISLVFLVQFN